MGEINLTRGVGVTPDDLVVKGGVEKFIQSGRIPQFVNRVGEEEVFCFIPPEGTAVNDTVKSVGIPGSIAYEMEFIAPDGSLRGSADMLTLTRAQAEQLTPRIERALTLRSAK